MSRAQLRYEPGLDGVRGLAVAAVLLYHAGFRWMLGGYLGVSTFFTLSGFLITSLLITEYESTRAIDLGRFWERRLRRILPAALATLAAVAVLSPLFADNYQRSHLRGDGFASLAWLLNWWFIFKHRGYADIFASPSLVQHFWSLAIEEQFYLVFPLLMLIVLRVGRGSRRIAAAVVGVLALASVLTTAFLLHRDATTTRLYYGADTRAAELLAGALLALVIGGRPRAAVRSHRALAVLGVAGLAVTAAFWASVPQDSVRLYAGVLPLYAAATAAVLAGAVLPTGPVRRLTSLPPLRWLGRVSYGVYLFHFPIFLWLTPQRTSLSAWPLLALRLVPTLLLAALSFRALEWPIRSRRLVRGRRGLAVPPVAAAVIGTLLVLTHRPPTTEAPAVFVAVPDVGTLSAAAGGARIMIVGDSVAERIGLGIERWTRQEGGATVVTYAQSGCGVADPRFVTGLDARARVEPCEAWKASWGQALARFRPDVVVVYSGGWDLLDREVPAWGSVRSPGDRDYDRWLAAEYASVVDRLSSHGARIVWLTSVCVRTPDVGPVGVFDLKRVRHLNDAIIGPLAAARPDRVTVVDLFDRVCPGGAFSDQLDGVPNARPDGVHFSDAAADAVARWLGPQILREARRARAAGDSTAADHTPAARRIAAADRSTSSSVVDQFEIDTRIAARPCQVVPPTQHVPSAWTRAMTSRTCASASMPGGESNATNTWFNTTSFSTRTFGAAASVAAMRRAWRAQPSTSAAIPERPSARSAA